jgi:hypothetical protein
MYELVPHIEGQGYSIETAYRMKIGKQLDDLRRVFPSCSVAVFADLKTGLVLASTAARKTSQERLDHLCACGADNLKGTLSQSVALTVMNRQLDGLRFAISITPTGFDVFVESPSADGEALCLICASDIELDPLIQHAQTLLADFDAVH